MHRDLQRWTVCSVAIHAAFSIWLFMSLSAYGMAGMGCLGVLFLPHQLIIFFLGARPPKISYPPFQFDYGDVCLNLAISFPASVLYGLCMSAVLCRLRRTNHPKVA